MSTSPPAPPAPFRPLAHEPLLSPGVARALVLALVVATLGLGAGVLGRPELTGLLRTAGILIAASALVTLLARRGEDRLERTPAIGAIVMAIASGLSAVAIIWLLNSGPDRPIGIVGSVASIGIITAAASAAASTAVLIRPHVEAMAAHVWSGIAGAGFAIPFMAAGAPPELIMAGAVLIGVVDRAGHRRRARALEARERAIALGGGARVDPRDEFRARERGPQFERGSLRLVLALGCTAIGSVVVAWAIGIAVGAASGDDAGGGQGFAAASLAAIPLAVQLALMRGAVARLRAWLAVGGGMLGLASIALIAAPLDPVFFAAVAVQSVAVALLAGALARRGFSVSTEGAVLVAIVAATAWWLVVVSTGGLVLAFVSVVTTLLALRRRGRGARRNRRAAVERGAAR
ncbi:hypothetical protein [Microcella alkalica]|uniref:Uncharacterized protein n=1 Tax=Microcella alkalica TaxID=355930 RepID=A0A839EG64_9MICO|nr:hypothetical protein [Microcella alkalica]MBA8848315.1 hypothetical protein [Microcella alkalica]